MACYLDPSGIFYPEVFRRELEVFFFMLNNNNFSFFFCYVTYLIVGLFCLCPLQLLEYSKWFFCITKEIELLLDNLNNFALTRLTFLAYFLKVRAGSLFIVTFLNNTYPKIGKFFNFKTDVSVFRLNNTPSYGISFLKIKAEAIFFYHFFVPPFSSFKNSINKQNFFLIYFTLRFYYVFSLCFSQKGSTFINILVLTHFSFVIRILFNYYEVNALFFILSYATYYPGIQFVVLTYLFKTGHIVEPFRDFFNAHSIFQVFATAAREEKKNLNQNSVSSLDKKFFHISLKKRGPRASVGQKIVKVSAAEAGLTNGSGLVTAARWTLAGAKNSITFLGGTTAIIGTMGYWLKQNYNPLNKQKVISLVLSHEKEVKGGNNLTADTLVKTHLILKEIKEDSSRNPTLKKERVALMKNVLIKAEKSLAMGLDNEYIASSRSNSMLKSNYPKLPTNYPYILFEAKDAIASRRASSLEETKPKK